MEGDWIARCLAFASLALGLFELWRGRRRR